MTVRGGDLVPVLPLGLCFSKVYGEEMTMVEVIV